MQNLDLTKINTSEMLSARKIFFVGIGGIGISAIARMMLLEGKAVFGSDMGESGITNELQKLGAEIFVGQDINFIPKDTELVVYTIAVPKYDPKFFEQLKKDFSVPILSYPQMLGIITANKFTIAVAGTHGKTTTTAMIAKILIDAGKDPTVIVGSLLKDYKSNFIAGKSEFFVVEACEYERSFLNIKPKILVITNIEADHLDYYKDLNDIKSAFEELKAQSVTVIEDYSKYLEKVPKLEVPGVHNRLDAAAALAVADALGIEEGSAQKSLAGFLGTWRRLEKKGITPEGTIVYDDYAHHPTEIRASLQGLREMYPGKKITVLFQPHLYSRTKALFDEFVTSFDGSERILLLPIYFAREAQDPSVSSEKLANAICEYYMTKENSAFVEAFADFELAETYLRDLTLGPNDLFVTMGAGEAHKVSEKVFHFE